MPTKNTATTIEQLSFEQALSELETIVRGLESGDTDLEQSITAYERGIALKKHCEAKLQEAQSKIEKITIANDGTVGTTPLDQKEEG
jgi:exodeoxyribonuclease VII small subunit